MKHLRAYAGRSGVRITQTHRVAAVAEWNPQRSGKVRRDLINTCRSAIARQRLGEYEAPESVRVTYNNAGAVVAFVIVEG